MYVQHKPFLTKNRLPKQSPLQQAMSRLERILQEANKITTERVLSIHERSLQEGMQLSL